MLILGYVKLNQSVNLLAFLRITFDLLIMLDLTQVIQFLSIPILTLLAHLDLIIVILFRKLIIVLDQSTPFSLAVF